MKAGANKVYSLPGYDVVQSGRSWSIFRRNLLPPSSGFQPIRLHDVTSQKTVIFMVTAVKVGSSGNASDLCQVLSDSNRQDTDYPEDFRALLLFLL
jgi:hypothetical protein